MKYSTKLSDAIHILVLIALNPLENLTSAAFANSIKTNPAFVRQIMGLLKKGGIITSVPGHPTPALAREPENITLFSIYKAVEGDKPLLHLDTHTNPECGVGVNIQYSIQQYYNFVQDAAEQKMKDITLQDIIKNYYRYSAITSQIRS
ncbi:MAG: Rrf2 family transcriptional regulator [Eubacteriales bacterium]|nr:Rrf2 family transcriptional regulator [Eubacteriales bacterium]